MEVLMRKNSYHCGDTVFLKSGVLGNAQPDGPGRIVSVMPEAQGTVRYRVRFQHENFERSVALDVDGLAARQRRKPLATRNRIKLDQPEHDQNQKVAALAA
jgi:hypothetical protein